MDVDRTDASRISRDRLVEVSFYVTLTSRDAPSARRTPLRFSSKLAEFSVIGNLKKPELQSNVIF